MKIYQQGNADTFLPSPTINPYWKEVLQLEGNTFWGTWSPNFMHIDLSGKMCGTRTKLVQKYSWAIPDPEALCFVVKHAQDGIVEMGAGMGYWAWQLTQFQIDVTAYDCDPPDDGYNRYHNKQNDPAIKTFHPVHRATPKILAQHADRTLFLCWPPYEDSMAYDSLKYYSGKKLIYIGEGDGGCTGDDMFHTLLDEAWDEIDSHRIMQWEGIHDHVYIYTRKEH